MEYRQGTVGRVFYVRFDHGENLLDELNGLAEKENIRCGWFQLFGGLNGVDVVTGPMLPVMPPEPVWEKLENCRETLGVGSIFFDNKSKKSKPLIHLHASMGHHGETLTGCVRKRAEVYLVIEAVVYELQGMDISRPWFEKGGFNRPEMGHGD
jgi:predicted DNA-binding protein with PD1-like motif